MNSVVTQTTTFIFLEPEESSRHGLGTRCDSTLLHESVMATCAWIEDRSSDTPRGAIASNTKTTRYTTKFWEDAVAILDQAIFSGRTRETNLDVFSLVNSAPLAHIAGHAQRKYTSRWQELDR